MDAATLSVTAYLVAGTFNDSIVSVAPLFWILLGTGIGINKIIKDNIKGKYFRARIGLASFMAESQLCGISKLW